MRAAQVDMQRRTHEWYQGLREASSSEEEEEEVEEEGEGERERERERREVEEGEEGGGGVGDQDWEGQNHELVVIERQTVSAPQQERMSRNGSD